jgi:hypothetical protein
VKRLGELLQVLERRVPFAVFSLGEICLLDVGVLRELFLCPSLAVTELSNAPPERGGGVVVGARHAKTMVRCRLKRDTLIVTIVLARQALFFAFFPETFPPPEIALET